MHKMSMSQKGEEGEWMEEKEQASREMSKS